LRANIQADPANRDANLETVLQADPQDRSPAPAMQKTAYYAALAPILSPATSKAIAQGTSQADRNALFLSSPEFMRR